MKLSILDLKAQYAGIKDEVNASLRSVLESQAFILGEDVKRLEEEIARYSANRYAVGVNSGTDAITLSLKALGVGPGDEVITTPFTFIATAEPVVLLGARPVFADIDPRTYIIDPALIEKAVTKRTKAIIAVHLYGQCADMDPILEAARRHKVYVIEDAAQAIGATYKGRKTGSMGDVAAMSFFPSKNLGAYGDGGMVVTGDKALADKVRLLRVHGSAVRYIHSDVGFNSRLDSLQAAVLRVKLKYLDKWLEARREKAEYYNRRLKGLELTTPYVPPYNVHTYHLYVLRVPSKAAKLMEFLNNNGVEARTYYPIPLHLQECFKNLGYKKGDFPEAEKAAEETLAIPIYPELKEDEMDYVVDKIREFYGK